MDKIDKKILRIIQKDSAQSQMEIAEKVGLSLSPCWRRLQNLEQSGVIQKRVALLSPEKLNLGVDVFVMIKTNQHNAEWLRKFIAAANELDEVAELYRMSGDIDYMMRIVVPDISAYDAFYKKLISKVGLSDISSFFAMERLKYTTELPLDYV